MTRSQAAAWATISAIVGAVVLAYVVSRVPPTLSDGSHNVAAIISLFGSVMLLVSGLGAIAALALHDRFPTLAGVDKRQPASVAAPEAALRQGILLAFAAAVLMGLALLGVLDPSFILVTLLLTALVEAFWQNRPSPRRL
jgi:hypothetical protein